MEVLSIGPFRVDSLVWQPRRSTWVRTVVCKATYTLQPGEAVLAPEQEPVTAGETHWGDDPAHSVYSPRDLVPVKPRAEVMLVGHAFAPGRVPVQSLVVRVIVGDADKSIEVFCDRTLTQDGVLQDGPRFIQMPTVYERAAGGPGTWNPVGMRLDARDMYGRKALPNLQPPGQHISGPVDFMDPIGFGPMAASWPKRVEKLGRHAAAVLSGKWLDQPLPDGVDLAHFNAAPYDQQLSALRDNERIVLENLNTDNPRLSTNLPGLRPAAFVDRARGAVQRLAMRADTLWIDTDRGICTLTWRGQLPVERPDEMGQVVIGIESPAVELSWAEVQRLLASQRAEQAGALSARANSTPLVDVPFLDENDVSDAERTLAPSFAHRSPVLPFAARPKDSSEPVRDAPPSIPGAGLPFQSALPSLGQPAASPWGADAALPFVPDAAAASVQPAVPPPVAPPAYVPPPPPITAARAEPESVWAGGAPTSGALTGETAGSVAAAAVAIAVPSTDRATQEGALAASNAAAAATPWTVPKRDVRSIQQQAAEAAPLQPAREMLQLLWFDPDSVARIRRVPAWRKLIEELERKPKTSRIDIVEDAKDPWEVEDRQEIFEILAQGQRTDGKGMEDALEGAIGEDGKFAPPLVLLAGELELPFDELEALKAAMSTAGPLVTPADEGLKAAVDVAKDFVHMPGLSAAPAVSEGLTTRIREAFTKEKKALPADYLDTQMERVLLAGRHYQKREVFGGEYLRCLIWLPGEQQPIVGYLPAEVGKKLPMWKRFRVRVIGEVWPAQDQYEAAERAVKVLAVGRAGGTGGAKG